MQQVVQRGLPVARTRTIALTAPTHLELPPTGSLPHAARLALLYEDLAPWQEWKVLALPAGAVSQLCVMGPMWFDQAYDEAKHTLLERRVPAGEVPRFMLQPSGVHAMSRFELLHALATLGHLWLPLLAAGGAADWMVTTFGATRQLPPDWRTMAL